MRVYYRVFCNFLRELVRILNKMHPKKCVFSRALVREACFAGDVQILASRLLFETGQIQQHLLPRTIAMWERISKSESCSIRIVLFCASAREPTVA